MRLVRTSLGRISGAFSIMRRLTRYAISGDNNHANTNRAADGKARKFASAVNKTAKIPIATAGHIN